MTTDTYNQIDNYAAENGLRLVETTKEMSGYPRELEYALVDFETFEDAKMAENELGGRIGYLTKRDGQTLWSRNGNAAYEPFALDADTFGYVVSFSSLGDFDKWALEELNFQLQDKDKEFSDIENVFMAIRAMREDIEEMDEDEIMLACKDGNLAAYEVVKKSVMSYHEDSKTYAIGLIFNQGTL